MFNVSIVKINHSMVVIGDCAKDVYLLMVLDDWGIIVGHHEPVATINSGGNGVGGDGGG